MPKRGRPPKADLINMPPHYLAGSTYESIKVIEAWQLGFCLGNAVKYICRCDRKGTPVADLEKAVWYLNHELENRREADNRLKGNGDKLAKVLRAPRIQATAKRGRRK